MFEKLPKEIVSDLGLDRPFIKGQRIIIKNCWHFSTDGKAVDVMFEDDDDFIAGMNRIYIIVRGSSRSATNSCMNMYGALLSTYP